MISIEYVKLMAAYTEWQNRSIFRAANSLSDAERRLDRGAFFGSIHATLNHLLWGDRVWLHRLAGVGELPRQSIEESVALYDDWDELEAGRIETDRALLEWSNRVTGQDFGGELSWYSGAISATVSRPRWTLTIQLFNHGTHHRGQVHAMLTSAGARPGDTDVQFMESDHFDW